jgi:hypothetical protein
MADDGVKVTLTFGEAEKGARDMLDEHLSDEKVPQADANYRPADTPDETCSRCEHYMASDQAEEASCEKVAGTVEAGYVSDLFEPSGEKGQKDPMSERPPFGGKETTSDEHE